MDNIRINQQEIRQYPNYHRQHLVMDFIIRALTIAHEDNTKNAHKM
jgi:hypothetical protein